MHNWSYYFRFLNWHMWSWAHPLIASILGGAGVLLHKWKQRVREDKAVSWPTTNGKVSSVDVKHHAGYWVVVDYSYFANDDWHVGKYRRYFRRKAPAEAMADALSGRTLLVRFNPNDAQRSVVADRDLHMLSMLQAL